MGITATLLTTSLPTGPAAAQDFDRILGTAFTADIATDADDRGRALALQPDGKIVAAGTGDHDFTVVHYNSDGSRDTSFDSDGKATTDTGAGGPRSCATTRPRPPKGVRAARRERPVASSRACSRA